MTYATLLDLVRGALPPQYEMTLSLEDRWTWSHARQCLERDASVALSISHRAGFWSVEASTLDDLAERFRRELAPRILGEDPQMGAGKVADAFEAVSRTAGEGAA